MVEVGLEVLVISLSALLGRSSLNGCGNPDLFGAVHPLSRLQELSVQLFSQANEMVATERKARAKLEARVEQLEKKDKDKMARLERLEKAVTRIDRVKALLSAPGPGTAPRRG